MTLPAAVLVITVLVLIYQPLAAYAVLGLVPPDAVQVSASADGRTLASHRMSDARTVADLYTRINRLPSALREPDGCGPGYPDQVISTYTFRFTRGGMLIEAATTQAIDGCVRGWELQRGGWGETHVDLTGTATRAILAEARLPQLPSQP